MMAHPFQDFLHDLRFEDLPAEVIRFARLEYLSQSASPNIRRLTSGTGLTTREIYALFPKAPGRSIARVAGIPKPAGCI